MHNADWVNQFLFFIEEVGYKSCAVALTPNYLVTFRHGTHQGYVKDSTVVRVVSLESGAQYEAAVVYINEEEDYVILKSNDKVVERNILPRSANLTDHNFAKSARFCDHIRHGEPYFCLTKLCASKHCL